MRKSSWGSQVEMNSKPASTGPRPEDAWDGTLVGRAVLGRAVLVALGHPSPPGPDPLASVLYDCRGDQLATLCAVNRQPITLQEVPVFLRQAVIATEDASFYRHGGISLRGIARAAWRDLTRGRLVEGASTITQQLARGIYLNPRRTIWRKLVEIYYAFKMELQLEQGRNPRPLPGSGLFAEKALMA